MRTYKSWDRDARAHLSFAGKFYFAALENTRPAQRSGNEKNKGCRQVFFFSYGLDRWLAGHALRSTARKGSWWIFPFDGNPRRESTSLFITNATRDLSHSSINSATLSLFILGRFIPNWAEGYQYIMDVGEVFQRTGNQRFVKFKKKKIKFSIAEV